jgi:hypothetical protein
MLGVIVGPVVQSGLGIFLFAAIIALGIICSTTE